jgi:hypothetical protein
LILLAASAKRYCVKKNTLICSQGQECKHVYIVKSGTVKLVRKICFLPDHYYCEKVPTNDHESGSASGSSYCGNYSEYGVSMREIKLGEARELFKVDPLQAPLVHDSKTGNQKL